MIVEVAARGWFYIFSDILPFVSGVDIFRLKSVGAWNPDLMSIFHVISRQ